MSQRMRASALVVTALAVVSACAGRGAPSPVDVATGPVFERALVDLDDAVLAARERVAARAGFPRADAFLASACFRPFELLVIGADTLRAPPLGEGLRRQCESEPGAGGRYVMIQEAPRRVAGDGGWRVSAYIMGVGTFPVWDAYVDADLSGGDATVIRAWWT